MILDPDEEKHVILGLKACTFIDFGFAINLSNNIIMEYKKSCKYTALISKWNNGSLIRSCLKSRWWWNFVDEENEFEKVDLWWT